MAKKPNAMGRIESEPKQSKKEKVGVFLHNVMVLSIPVALIVAGVFGTLKYQEFINGIKAQGVAEYKLDECQKFTSKDSKETWLECDE